MDSFPKIWALGKKEISNILDDEIEVTEKVDGSQFVFGVDDIGVLKMRSKGAMIYDQDAGGFLRELSDNDLFTPAVDYVLYLNDQGALLNGYTFYGETLCKPKHNILKYENVPKNNLMLFGVKAPDEEYLDYEGILSWATLLDVDAVRFIFRGKIEPENVQEWIETWMELESSLGGPTIEGVVLKVYKSYISHGRVFDITAGKYVSEKFKETHAKNWSQANTGKGQWDTFKLGFRTEARWEKAIQYLAEQGELQNDVKDIGPLIKRINQDILEEETEVIKDALYKIFHKDVLRTATSGFPQWYKDRLAFKSND